MNGVLWVTIITVVVVIFFILVYYEKFRYSRDRESIHTDGSSQDILYERYVTGEITIDQYQVMRNELQDHSPETVVETVSRYL